MKTHDLKLWPEYFQDAKESSKNFELRNNDRNFKVHDELLLKEFVPVINSYTGKTLRRKIIYILKANPTNGLKENYVILGLKAITRRKQCIYL